MTKIYPTGSAFNAEEKIGLIPQTNQVDEFPGRSSAATENTQNHLSSINNSLRGSREKTNLNQKCLEILNPNATPVTNIQPSIGQNRTEGNAFQQALANGNLPAQNRNAVPNNEASALPTCASPAAVSFPCGCTWSKFPLIVSVTAVCGILLTYTIARIQCHVQHFWLPYISYTGNYHPEHMIFGLILNAMSFLYALIIILIWRFMAALQPTEKRYHQNTCVVGVGSCMGLSIVANFQAEKAPYIHYMGAFGGFVLATFYILLVSQILASIHKTHPHIVPSWLVKWRWTVSMSGAVSFIICFLITSIAPLVPEFENHKQKDYYEESSNPNCNHAENHAMMRLDDEKVVIPKYAYEYNLVWSIGALFEWLNAFCYCTFMGLFYFEFSNFRHVKIILKDDNRQDLKEFQEGAVMVAGNCNVGQVSESRNSENRSTSKNQNLPNFDQNEPSNEERTQLSNACNANTNMNNNNSNINLISLTRDTAPPSYDCNIGIEGFSSPSSQRALFDKANIQTSHSQDWVQIGARSVQLVRNRSFINRTRANNSERLNGDEGDSGKGHRRGKSCDVNLQKF